MLNLKFFFYLFLMQNKVVQMNTSLLVVYCKSTFVFVSKNKKGYLLIVSKNKKGYSLIELNSSNNANFRLELHLFKTLISFATIT